MPLIGFSRWQEQQTDDAVCLPSPEQKVSIECEKRMRKDEAHPSAHRPLSVASQHQLIQFAIICNYLMDQVPQRNPGRCFLILSANIQLDLPIPFRPLSLSLYLLLRTDTKDGIGTHYWAFRHGIKMCACSWIMLTCIKSKFNSFSASWRNVHKCISINRRIGRSRAFCLLFLTPKGAAFDWANDEDENCCRIMRKIARLILLVRRCILIINGFFTGESRVQIFLGILLLKLIFL